jgi:hypothetical protein
VSRARRAAGIDVLKVVKPIEFNLAIALQEAEAA